MLSTDTPARHEGHSRLTKRAVVLGVALVLGLGAVFLCLRASADRGVREKYYQDIMSADADVERTAAIGIASLGSSELPRLVAMIDGGSAQEQAAAARVMSGMDVRPVSEALWKIAKGDDARKRLGAVLAMWGSAMDETQALPFLIPVLRSGSDEDRRSILVAILLRSKKPLTTSAELLAALDFQLDDSESENHPLSRPWVQHVLDAAADARWYLVEHLAMYRGGLVRIETVSRIAAGDAVARKVLASIADDSKSEWRGAASKALQLMNLTKGK